MGPTDIVTLARAGYKIGEIKEMIELEKTLKAQEVNEPDTGLDEVKQTPTPDEPKPTPEVKVPDSNISELQDALNKANEEIASLKITIQNIQKENINKDVSNNSSKTLEERLDDMFSKLY